MVERQKPKSWLDTLRQGAKPEPRKEPKKCNKMDCLAYIKYLRHTKTQADVETAIARYVWMFNEKPDLSELDEYVPEGDGGEVPF